MSTNDGMQAENQPRRRRSPPRKSGFFRKFVFLLIFLTGTAIFFSVIILGGLVYFNGAPPFPPHSLPDGSLRVEGDAVLYLEVRKGESAQSVGRRLEEAGIIRNRYFWQFVSRFGREYIKSGTYRLDIPAGQMEIYRILVEGRQMLQRVTFPEGATLKKYARILEEAGICGGEEFLAAASDPAVRAEYHVSGETMEGYLYPETYFFPLNYPASMVIRTLAGAFFACLQEIDPSAPELPAEELERRVIIASIVEREYRVDEEAALMAGVFYNRLEIGMALQSCATVEYVITEIQGKPHPEMLYTRDTEIRNPYNTYLMPGLPPGPISAPGRAALDAAFHPAESDYLYFRLVDPQAGRHYFSRTLDDHIRAGALYVKGRG
ncbi:MAG: endolytic transglycosylase MltG [Treponema sp.]|nr:endolytic transglycosylase MltG [Treponema sp.]